MVKFNLRVFSWVYIGTVANIGSRYYSVLSALLNGLFTRHEDDADDKLKRLLVLHAIGALCRNLG